MEDYFKKTKKEMETKIPDFNTKEFECFRNKIREGLQKKENDQNVLRRTLKVLILGDWNTAEKLNRLLEIKNTLLENGMYAETIDRYYDMSKRGGLNQLQILEFCCVKHNLIVFIDGEGAGTITEQNYLARTYLFHARILFFIAEHKFNELKDDPSSYIKDFPTIITFNDETDLVDKIKIFCRFRLYRLSDIILRQKSARRGQSSPNYTPLKERLERNRTV